VVIGRMALRPSASRIGTSNGRKSAAVALVARLLAVINGGLNLALATGGPGSSNGVVGAPAALVLGPIALVLGGLALARSRRPRPSDQRERQIM
jgi:Na+-driven multidrug efflux pump